MIGNCNVCVHIVQFSSVIKNKIIRFFIYFLAAQQEAYKKPDS